MMSLFYIFVINDPNNVGIYPPSVINSTWISRIDEYLKNNTWVTSPPRTLTCILHFENKTALDSWISEHTLTDPLLISDINTWKSAYGVSYQSYYFEIANATAITGVVS